MTSTLFNVMHQQASVLQKKLRLSTNWKVPRERQNNQSDCTKAKEKWLNDQCKEIEDLEERKQFRPMHQKIKELTGKKRTIHAAGICDREGNILFEEEKIAKRWVEYIHHTRTVL